MLLFEDQERGPESILLRHEARRRSSGPPAPKRRDPYGTEYDPGRQHAHALLDLLPDHKLHAVRTLLEVMVEPLSASLRTAPVEEEEITPETAAALDRAQASLARGEGVAHDDILREFGLTLVSEPQRIAVIWSPEARIDLRAIGRETALQTALQILYCLDRYSPPAPAT